MVFDMLLSALIKIVRDYYGEGAEELAGKLLRLEAKRRELWKTRVHNVEDQTSFHCLVHNDAWINNLMFK